MLGMRVVEAGWLLLDKPESPMHISSLMVFKQAKSYNVLHYWRKHFAKFRPSVPFNYVLKKNLQYPLGAWDDTADFSFEDHVRGFALAPGENGPKDLHTLAAWLHSLPLERDRPLWQLFVIEGLPDQHYGILIKIHHALTDGAFAMDLLERMLCHSPDERREEPFWADSLKAHTKAPRPEATWSTPLKSLKNFVPLVGGLGQGLFRSAIQRLPMTWPYRAPVSLFNKEITQRRHLELSVFPLKEIMDCAHKHEATLNDILLFLTGTALRYYLQKKQNLPEASLNALIPVSLRTGHEENHGCKLGFALAELGTHDAKPLQRLARIKQSMSASKLFLQNFNPGQKQVLTSALDIMFIASQMIPNLGAYIPPVANLLVSNLIGPRDTLYFNGDRLEQLIPLSVLADGQSINVTALSYSGQLYVSCISCPDLVADPELLQKGFAKAWNDLKILDPEHGQPFRSAAMH